MRPPRALPALAAGVFLAGCSHRAAETRLILDFTDGQCTIADAASPDRREIVDPERTDFRRWRGREVHLAPGMIGASGAEIPYRCFGAVIFGLQRAGVERIGFISEPAPASGEESE